jgi:hypothetical protein
MFGFVMREIGTYAMTAFQRRPRIFNGSVFMLTPLAFHGK